MSYRKITINNQEWQFVIGGKGVKLRDHNNKCKWVTKLELFNMTKEQYKDKYKRFDEYGDVYYDTLEIDRSDIQIYLERTNQIQGLMVKYK